MSKRRIEQAVLGALSLSWLGVPAHAGGSPASPYFSEQMLEQQDQTQRESEPGGAWNNAKVNVPAYVRTAGGAYGTPVTGLDGVTAGQGVATDQALPGVPATIATTQVVITGQGAVVGTATGAAVGAPGGFSTTSAVGAATGAALGGLKGLP